MSDDPEQKRAVLVIYKSANGRDGWCPVFPADVPEWLKAPEIVGRLVAGEQCCDVAQGPAGSDWYRAERIDADGATVQ